MNKEFKLRFRSGKSFLGVLFYLLAIGILVVGFVYVQSLSSSFGYFRPDESRMMFYFLSFLQLILILFIIPGLTAGVISGEREKQTLNILLTTSQSSASIVMGKLISAISYLLLLLFSSLPLYSFVFLYGGVSPSQIVSLFAFYLVTVFAIGSLGVLFSTFIRKTIVSIITAYSIMLFFALGTLLLFYISMALSHSLNPTATTHLIPYIIASLNPFLAMLSILEPGFGFDMRSMMMGIDLPLWLPYSVVYLLIFFLSMITSISKLRPKMKVKKKAKAKA